MNARRRNSSIYIVGIVLALALLMASTGGRAAQATGSLAGATATATHAPSATLPAATPRPAAPFALKDWTLSNVSTLPYGCKDKAPVCWRGVGRVAYPMSWGQRYWKMEGGIQPIKTLVKSYLQTKQPVRIESSWPGVMLTFWHKFSLAQPVIVRVQTGGVWHEVKQFRRLTTNQWEQAVVDLSAYKGQDVLIEISTTGANWWWVQDIQLTPGTGGSASTPATTQPTPKP